VRISEATHDLEFLGEFEDATFQFYRSEPDAYISCFVCWLQDEEALIRGWKEIAGSIAFGYQGKLDSKLDAWNIYLVFVLLVDVSKATKYEIENDKFSMRKLIVSNVGSDFSIQKYLNDELLGADLALKEMGDPKVDKGTFQASGLHDQITSLDSGKKGVGSFTSEEISKLANWVAENEN